MCFIYVSDISIAYQVCRSRAILVIGVVSLIFILEKNFDERRKWNNYHENIKKAIIQRENNFPFQLGK